MRDHKHRESLKIYTLIKTVTERKLYSQFFKFLVPILLSVHTFVIQSFTMKSYAQHVPKHRRK